MFMISAMYFKVVLVSVLGITFCAINSAQGQDYIFTAPADTQFIPYQQNQNQYIRPSEIIPFRQSPAGFQPIDASSTYLPRELQPHDLQTSDLPLHLQQTLPQYRFTTNQPFQKNIPPVQYNFQNHHPPVNRVVNTPVGFRPSQNIRPTTLRPNYSHLFAKSHNHDPSQTETFLGQITLQNPIETPPQFDEFKPSESFPQKSQEITSNAFVGANDDGRTNNKFNENSIQLGGRSSFLNHRTRIFAPDTSKKTTRTQVKDYFVNNNGDVYITTKIPFSPKPTTPTHISTTPARKNNFSPATKPTGKPLAFNLKSDKKGFFPKNASPLPLKSLDLEPLLEEPIKDGFESNNDDDVEVIQSNDEIETTEAATTVGDFEKQTDEIRDQNTSSTSSPTTSSTVSEITDQKTTSVANSTTVANNVEVTTLRDDKTEYDTGSPLDYNFSEELYDVSDGRESISNENDIQDEYPENSGETYMNNKEKELEDLKEEPIITTTQKNDSSYEVITMKPTTMVKESNFHDFVDTVEIDTTEAQSLIETTTIPMTVSMSSSVNIKKGDQMIGEPEQEPELVFSVVTSKTVVNNTVVAPATPIPIVTEAVRLTTEPSALSNEENTTDTWVVVASVQTSRSVSGARYLPSSIVEQEERVKLLNEHSNEEEESSQEDYNTSGENYHDNSEESSNNTSKETTTEEKDTTLLPTSAKPRTSTESLIDKLDRVQSDLSSGVLTGGLGNNIAVIKENMPEKVDMTTMVDVGITTSTTTTTTKAPYPQVNIRKFSPANRPSSTKRPKNAPRHDDPRLKSRYQNDRKSTTQSSVDVNEPQSDQPQQKLDISSLLPLGYKLKGSDDKSSRLLEEILGRAKTRTEEVTESTKGIDISKFLPPGYKLPKDEEDATGGSLKADDISELPSEEKTTEGSIFKNTKADDISKFLPPGYKLPKSDEKTTESSIFKNTKADDVAKFLPPGYKLPKSDEKTTEGSIFKNTKADDVAKFLPPGYKLPKGEEKTTEGSIFKNTKADDVAKFLPPGYKLPKSQAGTTESSIFKNTKADDVSKFLPPGYKLPRTTTTRKPKEAEPALPKIKPVNDISALLPPGYKPPKEESSNGLNPQTVDLSALLPTGYKPKPESSNSTESKDVPSDSSNNSPPSSTVKPAGGFKVVFPSRPGGGVRKSASRTTPRSTNEEQPAKPTSPTIHKGWPSRATTEFTGWPTPSTTPISIEKLLEAARTASTSTTEAVETTISTTSTTTTTTTTTPRPTTPGVCVDECDLAGTIKLVGGAKWVPELLDRNTKEWQILANEVQTQLDDVFTSSPLFGKWYKKIRIDGFSEGSVLVDYLVELNDLGRTIDTQEVKKYFHESLDDALSKSGSNREGKALNESVRLDGKLSLGNFIVDPKYTEFIVLPKQMYPTVGYAENDVLLPQWAIAVIVIGLASLLFVIIFGVTVLVNRQKNAKKKTPTPLTEDMLNELNKNHMGGFDNYGADDLYNMEDVWNDRGYDHKPPKKRSNGSIHDNSMSNLYDSWRSEWNGYYYNAYYGNNPGSSHSGYGRRRSDYDTNF